MQGVIFAIKVQLTYNYAGTVITTYLTKLSKLVITLEPRICVNYIILKAALIKLTTLEPKNFKSCVNYIRIKKFFKAALTKLTLESNVHV
jgi:hypothetical protein